MSKTWKIIIAIVIILIIVNIAALKYTGTPSFCGSCHIMEGVYDSWKVSDHAEAADCMSCHSDPGLFGYLMAKVDGIKHMITDMTKDVSVDELQTEINKESCIQCHEGVVEEGTHKLHEKMECGQCHQGVGHGAESETMDCGQCHADK